MNITVTFWLQSLQTARLSPWVIFIITHITTSGLLWRRFSYLYYLKFFLFIVRPIWSTSVATASLTSSKHSVGSLAVVVGGVPAANACSIWTGANGIPIFHLWIQPWMLHFNICDRWSVRLLFVKWKKTIPFDCAYSITHLSLSFAR